MKRRTLHEPRTSLDHENKQTDADLYIDNINIIIHLVRLMWRSEFDPKTVSSAVILALLAVENASADPNEIWIKRRTSHELNDWVWSVRRLTWVLIYLL